MKTNHWQRVCRVFLVLVISLTINGVVNGGEKNKTANPPIYIAFLWHMHQPIYWPYESIIQTENRGAYSFSIVDVHTSRTGNYTTWPWNAVQKGISVGFDHFGAQVSFSGSLIENLNTLESNGYSAFSNWESNFKAGKTATTSLGNPRLDMVGFGYHHPLMGLIRYEDIRNQIAAHRTLTNSTFGGTYSKGIFPPENAFSSHMIPALAAEGLEWVLVDNIHFDRAATNYPWNKGGSVVEPNRADQKNPDPGDWIQLNGLWAPTKNSAQWGRQPHYVQWVHPESGEISKIIAVPTDRYLGNEDGRGGFGALNYEAVMSQLESYNTDPDHPILIVLHHDGDNHGGGADYYYDSNFQSFVNWLKTNPDRFVCTTVQDYLELYPPDPNDVIHVEPGSWAGADAGDPEFKKWLGDQSNGYSPDQNSWGTITYAQNIVSTAEQQAPGSNIVTDGWKYLMNAQASDYWYWDGTEMWDSHPTRGANLAIQAVQSVIDSENDQTPPTIFLPQREPYNPGSTEWGITMPRDFTVWTWVADVNPLTSVNLRIRTDLDGINSSSTQNETYEGGSEVSQWSNIHMTPTTWVSQTNPMPAGQGIFFSATVTGYENQLLDYYVEATDEKGNAAKSYIQHVWVADGITTPPVGQGKVTISPGSPSTEDTITISFKPSLQGAKFHWGVNNAGSNWQQPHSIYWPEGSSLFANGPAVQSPMSGPADSILTIKIGPFNKPEQVVSKVAFVIHFNDDSWDNNNGQDYGFSISGIPVGDDSLVVHLYKPAAWNSAWCYFWNAGTVTGPGWPGTAMTPEGDGWFRFVIHGTTSANLIFSDNGNNQTQTSDLFRDKEGWYYNNQWNDSKPSVVSVKNEIPLQFSLGNPYPNPFNPVTSIPVSIPSIQMIRLEVFDGLGRQVSVLYNGMIKPGRYFFEFKGEELASGVYMVRLSGSGEVKNQRLVLVK